MTNQCECGHERQKHLWRIDHKRNDPEPKWCHECGCEEYRPKAEPPELCECGHFAQQHIYGEGKCRSGIVVCPCDKFRPEPKASPSLEDAVQKALDVHAEMVKINAPHGQTVHACEMCNALNDVYTATIFARKPSYDKPKATPSLEDEAREYFSFISEFTKDEKCLEDEALPDDLVLWINPFGKGTARSIGTVGDFARQQRRDVVEEFIDTVMDRCSGASGVPLIDVMNMVAKEMSDENA